MITIPTAEHSPLLKMDGSCVLCTLTFYPSGEYLASGGDNGIQIWRVKDGRQVATLDAKGVLCVAVSNDSQYIAAGTWSGDVFIWDAKTYHQVLLRKEYSCIIFCVDFSPDAAQLVFASDNNMACVLNVSTQQQVRILEQNRPVKGAKYAPCQWANQIATATDESVRVYDSNDGHLLVDVPLRITTRFTADLFWFNYHVFVQCGSEVKQIDATTGSIVSSLPLHVDLTSPCTALPTHGEFIAYSSEHTLTFVDRVTRTNLRSIEHSEHINAIALSPDDLSIAIAGEMGKIVIERLSYPSSLRKHGQHNDQTLESADRHSNPFDSTPEEHVTADTISQLTIRGPDWKIDDAIVDLWKRDRLINAESLLTRAIATTQNASHHLLASRALVRTRLREWDAAFADAEMAIKIQPSVIGYIAKSIALVGKGERDKGYQTCDIAFMLFHSTHVYFLLLIKAVIVFMAGEHRNAVSRVDDLIATVPSNSVCYVIQAYMYLLIGNSCMDNGDYEGATNSFVRARAQMLSDTCQELSMISLICGWKFENLDTTIQLCQCEALYGAGRIKNAVEHFHRMTSEWEGGANLQDERLQRTLDDFLERCFEKLSCLGERAVNEQRYDEAISHYTDALSLSPPSPQPILFERSKIYVTIGEWRLGLDDANKMIALDPSSPWGYQIKYTALDKAEDYGNAIDAFKMMLSKIENSPDPEIRQLGDQFIDPSSAQAAIRRIVQQTIRHSPRILIDTVTGRLHDKSEQASAFESLPIFNELVSSMTTRINYVRIKREVRQYFRYVMLSHKWEKNEPLFQQVIQTTVYDLERSPTHDKLQTFCKIVRDDGFIWAWSDTCCINKSDHFMLQEALVAMFKWYQGSALTIVFLRGVLSLSQLGALMQSIWNTRAWTLQEYIASKVIRFYTENWTLYLDSQLPNHKESREIISEMERATGVPAEQLSALRPGLNYIREKLRLASTRHTTLVEDAAYSLLGIFSVTGLPTIYGEGDGSLGRLLAHVLAGSGDVSVLAWMGESGSFNSCLPACITVFKEPATSHLPSAIPDAEMERQVTATQSSSFDLDTALNLYDHLNSLPAPWFAANRMKLPCIAFELPLLSPFRTRSGRIYRAETRAFGRVRIKTKHDLSRIDTLYLVHPWLDSVLEREGKSGIATVEYYAPPQSPSTDDEELLDEEIEGDEEIPEEQADDDHPTQVPPSHSRVVVDKDTRARRLAVRLRQPFGALLVTLASSSGRTVDYRRVAADSMITVRFQEDISLTDILDNVRTLDVL